MPRVFWDLSCTAQAVPWCPIAEVSQGPSVPSRKPVHLFSIFCQWNSHGYDVAKVFGGKFTQISPVWLQLKRRGREMFEVTGLHDVDQGSHVAAHLCSS